MATEACDGGTPHLGYVSGVSVFIGIFGVENKSGGSPSRPRDRAMHRGVGRAPTLVDGPGLFWPNSFTPGASFGPSKIIKNWHVNWTMFGIPFL